ncbi:hypothetical protein CSPAE12_07280 [Colletotrichum incanum]|nr:hypothetical protein CSPAE12_07280 [Colletotrichum incanum]
MARSWRQRRAIRLSRSGTALQASVSGHSRVIVTLLIMWPS